MKRTIYTFGDSQTLSYEAHFNSKIPWAQHYFHYLNYTPKTFSEILRDKLNYNLMTYARGGCSNYTIFDNFLQIHEKIQPYDIIIFGWTALNRFRIVNQNNEYVDLIPFVGHPKQHDDVNIKTVEEIAINKATHSMWYQELSNFINIIKKMSNTRNILHWTWVEPILTFPTTIWSEQSLRNKCVLNINDWINANDDTKKILNDSCDYIIDLNNVTIPELEHYAKLVNDGSKVGFLNFPRDNGEKQTFIEKNFKLTYYMANDYVGDFYKQLMPFKKYETITEHTNNLVKDIHISENGHLELANDILEYINKKPII